MNNIDVLDMILAYIGKTHWHGDSYEDDVSSANLKTLELVLENVNIIREYLIDRLEEHKYYRKGNASAESLHKQAKKIIENHTEIRWEE